MFLGTYHPRLDDKGRLVLPAKFREQLQEGLVVTRGQDHCLFVFPQQEFDRVSRELDQNPVVSGRGARNYSRLLFSSASDEVPDKQGRVTIPPPLREYARLERECVVIGNRNKVEVWDAASWTAFLAAQEEAFADFEDEVVPGLI